MTTTQYIDKLVDEIVAQIPSIAPYHDTLVKHMYRLVDLVRPTEEVHKDYPKLKRSVIRAADMKAFYEKGESFAEIGNKFGVSSLQVYKILRRYYPDITFTREKIRPLTERQCRNKNCQRSFISYRKSLIYCSLKCSIEDRTKYYTNEEMLEAKRRMAREAYQRKKKARSVKT